MCFDGCFALCQRLRSNDPTLTVVNLNNCSMGNDGCKALAAALQHNHTVVVLFLQHNLLGATGIQALTTALCHHPRLQHLYLDHNPRMGDAGCTAVAQLLGTLPSLQVLKMADTGITAIGAAVLVQALPNSNVQYLCLQKNAIAVRGMRALWQGLQSSKCSNLQWLDVRCNKISPRKYDTVMQGWIDTLKFHNETLSVLELWESTEMSHLISTKTQLQRQYEVFSFWLQWNRAGRRSLKHTDTTIPVPRLLANAAGASPTVLLATLKARPDLVVPTRTSGTTLSLPLLLPAENKQENKETL